MRISGVLFFVVLECERNDRERREWRQSGEAVCRLGLSADTSFHSANRNSGLFEAELREEVIEYRRKEG
jgi:hypothetical protein